MNLLLRLPFDCITSNGDRHRISFSRLAEPQWRDIQAPRPDFRGAAFQFAIAVLQTAFAPEDQDEWQRYWKKPPTTEQLDKALAPYVTAFRFDAHSPSFMQDYDLPEAEAKDIASLLIESPGENAIKKNLDVFVKRGQVQGISADWAALALFTLQINAPSGGAGHRVSVRGGGPLTTLLLPETPEATLWQKLWLNVLPQDEYGAEPIKCLADVLPWMSATRTSEAKTGTDTTPENAHPLQVYWSMPRRIRLDWSDLQPGQCDISGDQAEHIFLGYRTRNYGINYTGAWMHPLTPYSLDPKTGPLSIKGQPGGIGYRHWLGLTLGSEDGKPAAALVVDRYHRLLHRQIPSRLWCFGYDMDNMKARCWYDSLLPVHVVEPAKRTSFIRQAQKVLETAKESVTLLNKYVKAAQFNRPGEIKSNPAVSRSYWQTTESDFYRFVSSLSQLDPADERQVASLFRQWLIQSRSKTLQLFDTWAQSAPIEDCDARRVVEARAALIKWLNAGKPFKQLWEIINTYHKKEAA